MPKPEDLPLSLYIHVPWCVRKCPYCDFNSHERSDIPETDYLKALLDDLATDAHLAAGRPLQSLFIGGGTPSLMSPDFYRTLLTNVQQHLGALDGVEITLEANPGTVDEARFAGFRAAGINRLSLGVQSFNDAHLAALGRIHDSAAAERAVHRARAAGFDNINIDLMYGLPGQGVDDALSDLNRALALGPEHLSWYELTIEPNTAFFSKPPPRPDDELLADMEDAGHTRLAAAGYGRYEVSAYARPGRAARHNLNYWTFGDYLALGAGGHGKVTLADGSVMRYQKTRQPEHYLSRIPRTRGQTTLDRRSLVLEYFLNSLRLVDGAPAADLPARTGVALDKVRPTLAYIGSKHLLSNADGRIKCTPLGLTHLNSVLSDLEDRLPVL